MKLLTLLQASIKDDDMRENFKRIETLINGLALLKGQFKFFSITVASAVTALKFPHQLKFQPKDVLQLSVSAGATVTWLYDSFDSTNLVLTTSGACTVRLLAGCYAET